MATVNCPSCGHPVGVPEKMTGLWWGIGCLIAVPALLTVVAIAGLLAAIAIPSFVQARQTSQMNACTNNMRQIDSAKESWALASNIDTGEEVDCAEINQYLRNGVTPACPAGGTYTYHEVGQEPECSVHGRLSATHRPRPAAVGWQPPPR